MKFSDAMLKGYMTNGGRQCVGQQVSRDGAMCAVGAYLKGVAGDPEASAVDAGYWPHQKAFRDAYGFDIVDLNNHGADDLEPFPWEHIYGMARAAGL